MAFRDGVLVYRQPGAMPAAALEDLITRVKALDMAEVRAKIAAAKLLTESTNSHRRVHVLPREVPQVRKNRLGRLRSTRRRRDAIGALGAAMHLRTGFGTAERARVAGSRWRR